MSLFCEYHGPADEKVLQLVARRPAKRDALATAILEPLEGDVVEAAAPRLRSQPRLR